MGTDFDPCLFVTKDATLAFVLILKWRKSKVKKCKQAGREMAKIHGSLPIFPTLKARRIAFRGD
jgi:hypothetical protein